MLIGQVSINWPFTRMMVGIGWMWWEEMFNLLLNPLFYLLHYEFSTFLHFKTVT